MNTSQLAALRWMMERELSALRSPRMSPEISLKCPDENELASRLSERAVDERLTARRVERIRDLENALRRIEVMGYPTEGELKLFGASGLRELNSARKRTSAVVETPSFYPYLSGRDNLEYYRIQRGIAGRQAVDEVLEIVDLQDTGRKKFKNYSLGMKQRLGLALAVMNHPDFLILDEPINGLDPLGIVMVRNLLIKLNKERGITILISRFRLPSALTYAICQSRRKFLSRR